MKVNKVKLLPLGQLRPHETNPKRPLGAKYRRGLSESQEQFGFSGALCVADNLDGTFEILDGTTRSDDLLSAGVQKAPCVIVDECAGDPKSQDVRDRRTKFRLAYDRNRKVFDEDEVTRQVKELLGREHDAGQVARLAALDNIRGLQESLAADVAGTREKMLAASQRANAAIKDAKAAEPKASLVLYGPASEIQLLRETAKEIRGRMSIAEKFSGVMVQARDNLDLDDDTFSAIFLATLARWSKADGEPMANP